MYIFDLNGWYGPASKPTVSF